MGTASKLVHPGTAFLQSLPYIEVALKDMTREQQTAIFNYMNADGEGYWGAYDNVDVAVFHLGDVKFGVGHFDNDDTFKAAFVASIPNGIDEANPVEYFNQHCVCNEKLGEAIPVILASNPDLAPEFGMFDDGYDQFYEYWAKQPGTEFVRCLPGWDCSTDDGRGGQ